MGGKCLLFEIQCVRLGAECDIHFFWKRPKHPAWNRMRTGFLWINPTVRPGPDCGLAICLGKLKRPAWGRMPFFMLLKGVLQDMCYATEWIPLVQTIKAKHQIQDNDVCTILMIAQYWKTNKIQLLTRKLRYKNYDIIWILHKYINIFAYTPSLWFWPAPWVLLQSHWRPLHSQLGPWLDRISPLWVP